MDASRKKRLFAVIRAAVGLTVLAFIVSRVDRRQLVSLLAQLAWGPVLLALLVQTLVTVGRSARWKEILHANGIDRGFVELLALMFIGLFFNSFLPTAVGGDVVRGYYTARGEDGRLASYASLVVERLLGLVTLALVAAAAAGVALAAGADSPLPRRLLLGVAAGGVLIAAVVVAGFGARGWRARLERAERLGPAAARLIAGTNRAIDLFHRPTTRGGRIVALSFGLQLLAVLFHIACARAVGLETPSLVFFLVVPASVVAAMLPVSLNGLGVREGVLVGLLVAYGAPAAQAAAFALVALLAATAFPIVGGLIYPFYRGPRATPA